MALFRTRGKSIKNIPQGRGTITSTITSVRGNAAGGSGNTKMYFAGGINSSNNLIDTVTCFSDTTVTTPTSLSIARCDMGSADSKIDDGYVLFVGGQMDLVNEAPTNIVDAFKVDTGTRTTVNLPEAKKGMDGKGLNNGKYYLFCGGYTKSSTVWQKSSYLEIFDDVLTRTRYDSLVYHAGKHMAMGRSYHLWGDNNEKWSDDIDGLFTHNEASNPNVQHLHASMLSTSSGIVINTLLLSYNLPPTDEMGTASMNFDLNKAYYLYAGGVNMVNNKMSSDVLVYDDYFTELPTLKLSVARKGLSGISFDTACMFVGGETTNGEYSNVVDVFDNYLTRIVYPNLSDTTYRPTVAETLDSTNNEYYSLINLQDSTNPNTIRAFSQKRENVFNYKAVYE